VRSARKLFEAHIQPSIEAANALFVYSKSAKSVNCTCVLLLRRLVTVNTAHIQIKKRFLLHVLQMAILVGHADILAIFQCQFGCQNNDYLSYVEKRGVKISLKAGLRTFKNV